jgi:hypothetical protein
VLAPGGVLFLTNRVGREARLLPGRAMPRSSFKQVLNDLPLREVQVRIWQVNYDLAMARKAGSPRLDDRGELELASVLRCPHCRGPLQPGAASLTCVPCKQRYPIRKGIVHMADSIKQGES